MKAITVRNVEKAAGATSKRDAPTALVLYRVWNTTDQYLFLPPP